MKTSHPLYHDNGGPACACTLQAPPALEAQIASCPDCRCEPESRGPAVDRSAARPADVLRPPASLQARLALRIARQTGKPPVTPPAPQWAEPGWEPVAPGIECKLLAADMENRRVSILMRLAPGASYPARTYAGPEEIHLLDGELWVDDSKLTAGDYNYGRPETGGGRVWSETGCTCFLVAGTRDVPR